MEKKTVDKIVLKRLDVPEGYAALPVLESPSWDDAEQLVKAVLSPSAPDSPKFHRVEVTLHYGEDTITLPYDLTRPPTSLRFALLQHIEFMAAILKPDWMSTEEWEDFRIGQEETAEIYQEYLDQYEI